jgi:hypothetical protein
VAKFAGLASIAGIFFPIDSIDRQWFSLIPSSQVCAVLIKINLFILFYNQGFPDFRTRESLTFLNAG